VEKLCDRVAIFDHGRIVDADTPAGLIADTSSEHRLRFRPMAPLNEASLTGLPGVTAVERSGDQVVVTGTGDFADAVTGVLAREQIIVANLRIEERTLDDAYLALTGQPFDAESTPRADQQNGADRS
jgi:ABC-2 type transport system ATP-binding protein